MFDHGPSIRNVEVIPFAHNEWDRPYHCWALVSGRSKHEDVACSRKARGDSIGMVPLCTQHRDCAIKNGFRIVRQSPDLLERLLKGWQGWRE